MAPYDLPADGVVSGIKSSTHKGKGYNEMSMNDTAGKEKITIHGQYDMATTVEHDLSTALEAREAQLRTLIDAMPDIVCFKDDAGRWREANTFALRLLGLDRVAYRDKTDAELASYSPLDRQTFQRFEDSDELAWQRGEPSRSDERLPQPDWSEKIFDVIRIPRFDDRQQRHSLLVVGRNISDRQYAEQQLRQSEEKFARIFQTTPNVVVISRVQDGVLLDVNPGDDDRPLRPCLHCCLACCLGTNENAPCLIRSKLPYRSQSDA